MNFEGNFEDFCRTFLDFGEILVDFMSFCEDFLEVFLETKEVFWKVPILNFEYSKGIFSLKRFANIEYYSSIEFKSFVLCWNKAERDFLLSEKSCERVSYSVRSLIFGMLVLRAFCRIKICTNSNFKDVWHASKLTYNQTQSRHHPKKTGPKNRKFLTFIRIFLIFDIKEISMQTCYIFWKWKPY